ncbi:hypothetical protein V5O48_009555 [Marasmius crinis-equi]|uniref:F-box domain-containing protein n=1 Tax=Marasmius crinis-equi TaxID=585013 RepID=A0ABR3FB42_9AGAR
MDLIAGVDSVDADCWRFLPLLENMKTCSLEIHPYLSAPPDTIRLAHLHTLTLELRCGKDPTASLIDMLILPALNVLRLHAGFGPALAKCIISLIARSPCHLKELTLSGSRFADIPLAEFMSSDVLRKVEKLSLGGGTPHKRPRRRVSVPDKVLDALRFVYPKQTPLPYLRSLTISDVESWSDSTLLNMLISRRCISQFPDESVFRLEEVFLQGVGERRFKLEDDDARAQLKGLVEDGLVTNFS